jgi:uncharacterized protein (TIGR04255 family)
MVNPRHLSHAPITEALVDFRAAPTTALEEPRILDRLKSALADRYPKHSWRSERDMRPSLSARTRVFTAISSSRATGGISRSSE